MNPANPAQSTISAGGRKKAVWIAFALFVVYAALAWAYFRHTAALQAPPGYAGTAADPAVFMPPDVLNLVESYKPWAYFFSFVIPAWQWLVFWALVASGAAARWQAFLERPRIPRMLRFPVYVLLVWTVVSLLFLPFRFADYRVAAFHGVATQSVRGWFADDALSFALDCVLILIALGLIRWFLSRGGRWKAKLVLAAVPLVVLLDYVYPALISPMFTPVKPVSDERLERSILALAERADVPVDRVYEAEMSSVTAEMNATISGFGSSLRIVVWDTMLEGTCEKELLFVLAHELGHYVHRDTLLYAANGVFWTGAVIGAGAWLYERIVTRWGPRWGIRRLSDLAGLPLIQWFDDHPGISKRIAAALQFGEERKDG